MCNVLVLTRKIGESIKIGDTWVHFKSRRGNLLSVAIDAPREVRVLRGECVNANGEGAQEREFRENAPPRSQESLLRNAETERK